jgi:phage-related protein
MENTAMALATRPISWLKPARKDFEKFPAEAQTICLTALTIAAEGGKADTAKPVKGLGSGIFEIALAFRGNAYRVVYAVQIGEEIWVLHAFQKKSTRGIKTPQHEIELIEDRIKRLKELLG